MCPVQAEGLIDDHPYYFRSRGSHWEFHVGELGGNAVGGPCVYYKAGYVGEWPAAGYLPVDDAKRIIAMCVEEFRSGKRGVLNCSCEECVKLQGMTGEERARKFDEDLKRW